MDSQSGGGDRGDKVTMMAKTKGIKDWVLI